MVLNEELSIEEKLRIIRKQKGIPQLVIADALGVAPTTISRIENKHEKYSYNDGQIKVVRKLLGVENAPLLDGEDVIFKKRLYVWLDIIKSKCFDEADKLQDELSSVSNLSFKAKNYSQALGYIEDAFEYLKKDEWLYLENLYYKARCLIALKSPLSKEVISQAKSTISINEDYHLMFTSLANLLTLKDESSCQYIEHTTIPYLLDKFKYSKALDYCEVLGEHFAKKRNIKKALEMKALAGEIKDRIMKGCSVW